jgi:hypothetical protein
MAYPYLTGSPTWILIGARPPLPRYSAPIVRSLALLGILRRLNAEQQKRATKSKKVKRESSSELSEGDEASARQQDPSVKVEATTKEEQEGEVDSGRRKSRRGKTNR